MLNLWKPSRHILDPRDHEDKRCRRCGDKLKRAGEKGLVLGCCCDIACEPHNNCWPSEVEVTFADVQGCTECVTGSPDCLVNPSSSSQITNLTGLNATHIVPFSSADVGGSGHLHYILSSFGPTYDGHVFNGNSTCSGSPSCSCEIEMKIDVTLCNLGSEFAVVALNVYAVPTTPDCNNGCVDCGDSSYAFRATSDEGPGAPRTRNTLIANVHEDCAFNHQRIGYLGTASVNWEDQPTTDNNCSFCSGCSTANVPTCGADCPRCTPNTIRATTSGVTTPAAANGTHDLVQDASNKCKWSYTDVANNLEHRLTRTGTTTATWQIINTSTGLDVVSGTSAVSANNCKTWGTSTHTLGTGSTTFSPCP